jgi:hypothetical protein
MLSPSASIRALGFHRRLPLPHTPLLLPPRPPPHIGPARSLMPFSTQPAGQEEGEAEDEEEAHLAAAGGGGEVSHEEWQRWGTTSPLPAAVAAVVRELLEMEAASGEKMRFGGVGSKLKVTPFKFGFLPNPYQILLVLVCCCECDYGGPQDDDSHSLIYLGFAGRFQRHGGQEAQSSLRDAP